MSNNKISSTNRRNKLKQQAINFLGGKCQLCGYDKCPAALEMHHIDPMEKEFTISKSSSWNKIKPELMKCVLLCSNCHRETHAGFNPMLLAGDDRYIYEEGGEYDEENDN